MKLKELLESSTNNKTIRKEKEALADVNKWGPAIQFIDNPSEAVKLAAVTQRGFAVVFIKNPTQLVISTALKEPVFIGMQHRYERFIKEYFADNTLLMKKWLRYGEAMRNS
ncbi:hypothetical protein M0R04_07000 [Candidatus Dojkabacteria bacterium]|jgi:hypothetical protein|nr:hypothetical protein [Candidatus Dojkabacteria bacterium]